MDEAGVAGTRLDAAGLSAGTTFFWRVLGSNDGGSGPWSQVRSFRTVGGPPGVPVLVSPPLGAAELPVPVALAWNPVPGADRYRVQIDASGDFGSPELEIADLEETTATTASVTPGETRYWRVRAEGIGGAGLWSNPGRFTTAAPAPGSSVLLTPADNAEDLATTVTLVWSPVAGAASYDVQLSEVPTFGVIYEQHAVSGSTQYVLHQISAGKSLYWRTRARNAAGSSPWSDVRRFRTAGAGIAAVPALLRPAYGAPEVSVPVHLEWSGQSGRQFDVEVYREDAPSEPAFRSEGITSAQVTVEGLEPGAAYTWRVRPVEGTGSGSAAANTTTTAATAAGWTDLFPFQTAPSAPGAPALLSPADGASGVLPNVSLSWTPLAGAQAYRVQVSSQETFVGGILADITGLPAAQATLTGLPEGSRIYWRVRADNAGGAGPWSVARSFVVGGASPLAIALSEPIPEALVPAAPLTLIWQPGPSDARYRVQLATTPTFAPSEIDQSDVGSAQFAIADPIPDTRYYWRVQMIVSGSPGPWSNVYSFVTGPKQVAAEDGPEVPMQTSLAQNYPNPFNETTTVGFDLAEAGRVSLTVYDLLGRRVAVLLDEVRSAGRHTVLWQPGSLPSGAYFCVLRSGDTAQTRSMVRVK